MISGNAWDMARVEVSDDYCKNNHTYKISMTAANDFEDQRRHLRRITIVILSRKPCIMQLTFIAFSQHCTVRPHFFRLKT